MTKTKKKIKWKRYLPLYLMMLPGAAYLVINNYIPMGGLILAFKRFNYSLGIMESPWAGLGNFTYLFTGKDAFLMMRNTLSYNFVFIVLGTILAITVAILLNEVGNMKARKTYQTLILVPYLISIVIVSYIVYAFLSQDSGFVNNTLLKGMGKKSISWYTSPQYWPFILCLVYLWKSFGYHSIIYYATIIGIDSSYYEAATVDGATKWKQVWYITLPSLKPTIITLTLLSIGRIFYSDFGLFYQVPMNSGPLLNATSTIDTYVYRALLTLNDVGRSSAAGFLQSILGFIVVFSANLLVNKINKENALF
ncbi:MAG TPA: sugar ABC transporter permease [Candidatus Pelethocola excrementipullorum]|nr:sugar ABC transporter permease [Candidatus Pelethocola excrementipullorum]